MDTGVGPRHAASWFSGDGSVEGEVEERDADRAGEEQHEDSEQEPAEDQVLALDLGSQVPQKITGSRAAATNSNAR